MKGVFTCANVLAQTTKYHTHTRVYSITQNSMMDVYGTVTAELTGFPPYFSITISKPFGIQSRYSSELDIPYAIK